MNINNTEYKAAETTQIEIFKFPKMRSDMFNGSAYINYGTWELILRKTLSNSMSSWDAAAHLREPNKSNGV